MQSDNGSLYCGKLFKLFLAGAKGYKKGRSKPDFMVMQ
jgi:hypothetical protein